MDDIDVVKISEDDVNPEIYRITRPYVKWAQRDVLRIPTLNPGDAISFDAGGCVQTGSRVPGSRRYVDPSGPDSDRLYHGTVWLPGWFTPIRIGSFVPNRTQYVVPPGASGPLSIGYEDDDYPDNGYTDQDDGIDDQCKGRGDAWITVTITRAYLYINHFHSPKGPHRRGKPIDYLAPDSFGKPMMKAGGNGESKEATPTVDLEGVTIEIEPIEPTIRLVATVDVNGTPIEIETTPRKILSRTVYLVSNVFSAAGFLRAEVEFDMPNSTETDGYEVWGVALNFKNGDETDLASDTRYGPSCQFVNGGRNVHFHFQNGPQDVDLGPFLEAAVNSAAAANSNSNGYSGFIDGAITTRFRLAVQICRDNNGVTASYAELYINDMLVGRGQLATAQGPLQILPSLGETLADPSLITAAGFAIVTNNASQASARFRSFALQYQYGPCVLTSGDPVSFGQPPIASSPPEFYFGLAEGDRPTS